MSGIAWGMPLNVQRGDLKTYLKMMTFQKLERRCQTLFTIITGYRGDAFRLPDQVKPEALQELIHNRICNNHPSVDGQRNCMNVFRIIGDEKLYRNERIILFLVYWLAKYYPITEQNTLLWTVTNLVEEHREKDKSHGNQIDNLVASVVALQHELHAEVKL